MYLGLESWPDGSYYQGEFVCGLKEGIGVMRWPDGVIFEGEWQNNAPHGYVFKIYLF